MLKVIICLLLTINLEINFFTEVLSKFKNIHIKSNSLGNLVALNLVKEYLRGCKEIEWDYIIST